MSHPPTRRYVAFGRVVDSDRPLPLPPAGPHGDAEIRLRTSVEFPRDVLHQWTVPGYASLVLSDDHSVSIHGHENLPGGVVDHLLIDLALPVALGVWVAPVLHASAVAEHDVAVLFTGPSGAGKSTLVVGCARAGMRLLSDDAVLLDEGGTVAVPQYPTLRLRADHAQRLLGDGAVGVSTMVSGKHRLDPLRHGVAVETRPTPIGLVLAIEPRHDDDRSIELRPCGPAEATAIILQGLFLPDRSTVGILDDLELSSRLARGFSVARLAYPRSLEALGDVVDTVASATASLVR